ncbi:MAG TPA: hypothetical protein VEW47_08930 [Candidatus Dormibacteraeota bacterium]|nr:hypothetical protein [Candidatus Dormibacteraeota bacterium]
MRPPVFEYHRRLLSAVLVALLLGCGRKSGDGGGGGVVTPPPPPTPTFRCTDSLVMVNKVALKCGAPLPGNVWQIDVVIGTPTTSTDIGGFAFDLLFDPTILEYVPDSARAGAMLYQDADTPLLIARISDPGRLVVGINRTSGAAGVQGIPGYDLIMSFSMKAVPGAEFDADPRHLAFDMNRFQALDSSAQAQPIPSITFSDQLLLSVQ